LGLFLRGPDQFWLVLTFFITSGQGLADFLVGIKESINIKKKKEKKRRFFHEIMAQNLSDFNNSTT
jgi:hypothetical protein